MAHHTRTSKHKNKKKRILENEEKERLKILNEELLEEKIKDIIAALHDHPLFLWWEWEPLGNFLKVFKVHPEVYGVDCCREFLVSLEADADELILEGLAWMDVDF